MEQLSSAHVCALKSRRRPLGVCDCFWGADLHRFDAEARLGQGSIEGPGGEMIQVIFHLQAHIGDAAHAQKMGFREMEIRVGNANDQRASDRKSTRLNSS